MNYIFCKLKKPYKTSKNMNFIFFFFLLLLLFSIQILKFKHYLILSLKTFDMAREMNNLSFSLSVFVYLHLPECLAFRTNDHCKWHKGFFSYLAARISDGAVVVTCVVYWTPTTICVTPTRSLNTTHTVILREVDRKRTKKMETISVFLE